MKKCARSIQVFAAASLLATLASALQNNLEKFGKELPTVEKLVSTDVWHQMYALGAELTNRLHVEQARTQSKIVNQQKLYSERLGEQRAKNNATLLEISVITKDIDALQLGNTKLQQQADSLVRSCGQLREDIKIMQVNVSTAAEFLDTAISDGDHLLDQNASELLVLNALDANDRVQNEERYRTSRFASMLQTAVEGPQDVMQSMVSELGNVTTERNASMMKLRQKFDTEMKGLETDGEPLVAELSRLNATRDILNDRHVKLTGAVEHLHAIHVRLLKQAKALRLFTQRLAHSNDSLKRLSASPNSTAPEQGDDALESLPAATNATTPEHGDDALEQFQVAPNLTTPEQGDDALQRLPANSTTPEQGDDALQRLPVAPHSNTPEQVMFSRIPEKVLGGGHRVATHTKLDADAIKSRLQKAEVLAKHAEATATLLSKKAKQDGKASTKAVAQKAADAAAEAGRLVAKLKAATK